MTRWCWPAAYAAEHEACDGCGYSLCTDEDCARVRADEDEDAAKEREASDE